MATVIAGPRLSPSTSYRVPSLDGWRGIAIALVLIDHIQIAFLGRYPHPWCQTGMHGVTIFFVLSGYLITSKLLEAPISLKRFYLRRLFRLMPVAWTYLLSMVILDKLYGAHIVSWDEIRSCLFFYRNYVNPSTGGAGHFWTLSIEEQFYIVWPCILWISGVRRSRWIVGVGAVGIAVYRFVRWDHYNHGFLSLRTEVRADALMIGCLLALSLRNSEIIARWSKVCALPAFFVLLYSIYGIDYFHGALPLFEDVAIAILIAASTLNPLAWFTRMLTAKALTYLGLISYSLYVWQEIFMRGRGSTEIFMLAIGLPLCALGSYYFIERPCNRLGYRIAARLR